jgi:non-ribosomal peptide synthetase component F
LATFYNSFISGSSPALPRLSVQYADYAWWQRQYLPTSALDKQLAYWRQQLRGAPEVVSLPTDHSRPPVRTFRGRTEPMTISKEVTDRFMELGRKERATLFVTLLSAFKTLLWWYAGEDDVVVGTPGAGRTRKETELLIGHFVNSLVLRANLSGDPDFREVVHRVHDVTLGALANQDVPFEKLVDDLRVERNLAYNPLFQVWFVLLQARQELIVFDGLTVEPLRIENPAARHDLQLTLVEDQNGLKGSFTYNSDLFEPPTVARMARQLELLLFTVAARPGIRLSELRCILDEAEKEYRAKTAKSLEETTRRKLKSVKRRTVTGTSESVPLELSTEQR